MAQDNKSRLGQVFGAVAASGRLKDFLDLVAADLSGDTSDKTPALLAFWQKNKSRFEGDDVVIEFSRFLRDHMPKVSDGHYQEVQTESNGSQSVNINHGSKEFAKAAEDFSKAMDELSTTIANEKELLRTSLSKYKYFPVIFSVDPYWDEYRSVFGRLDPGVALSSFFGRYYSNEITSPYDLVQRDHRISDSSMGYALISEINGFVKLRATADEAAILDQIVAQPRSSTRAEKIAFFRKASTTTQVLFEAYIISFTPSTTDELEILFRLPFAIDPAADGAPHCTFQLLAWGAEGDDPHRNESRRDAYREAARQLFKKLREARRREYGGRSPYSASIAHDIFWTISSGADVQCIGGDLKEIREVIDVDEPLLWSVLDAVSICYDLSDSSNFDELADIVDDYLTITESFIQNGDIEPAQYLLAFVVFCLVKTMEGNLAPFPKLFRLLSNASSTLPYSSGAEALSGAMSFLIMYETQSVVFSSSFPRKRESTVGMRSRSASGCPLSRA
jgi:hypothetical protein